MAVSSVSADVNRRVLIVNDNQAIHTDFRKILAGPGAAEAAMDELAAMLFSTTEAARHSEFELDSAFQGREALERVTRASSAGRPYALAFVDMRMPPGWDGLETIEHIWRADPLLQIVICSAYSDHSWEDLRDRGWARATRSSSSRSRSTRSRSCRAPMR